MKTISEMLPPNTESLSFDPGNMAEYIDYRVKTENEMSGSLSGYDCPICKNKGYISIADELEIRHRECECRQKRRILRSLNRSGLQNLTDKCSFENYRTQSPWQLALKTRAEEFLDSQDGAWMYIGGQVGCGKTHLCAAAALEFIRRGERVKYMLWKEDAAALKAIVNDPSYAGLIGEFKAAPILYIDDFLKSRGEGVSVGDINLAFELINYRYLNSGRTIISSEKTIDDIMDIDEAVGSRIYERSKGYRLIIPRDQNKNYRLK